VPVPAGGVTVCGEGDTGADRPVGPYREDLGSLVKLAVAQQVPIAGDVGLRYEEAWQLLITLLVAPGGQRGHRHPRRS
jgi:hypothetical protein